ncbi:hypothetical protein [Roseicella sp. DB1501]|uniref:hypothetical protein n=1 Tax=Roseicella sp. DB1501 TaxID=2730925 RepID=UPI001490DCC4|nr:hypothetical protein [Roseicella sp. DB1501]NOG70487.1 hypothetical protein [Roseicella sp. DB1501]
MNAFHPDHPDWQRYRRAWSRARFAAYGIVWSLIGSLAVIETAEVLFGALHLPGLAYAVSAGFAVWSWFAYRQARRIPRPTEPGLSDGSGSRPLPSTPSPAPQQRTGTPELVDA